MLVDIIVTVVFVAPLAVAGYVGYRAGRATERRACARK